MSPGPCPGRPAPAGRVWILADQVSKYGMVDDSIRLWSECDAVGDHVTVYDGLAPPPGSTAPSSPPLVVFCRGGRVPDIVSGGPDMRLVFQTSPYSVPRYSTSSLNGLESNLI